MRDRYTDTHTHTHTLDTKMTDRQTDRAHKCWRQLLSCDFTTPRSSACWCTRQSTAWHHVISTNCASQFRLFPTFLFFVPLLVAICWYPGQGCISSTGHFVWLVAWNSLPLDIRSAPTLSSFKNMLKTHLFSRSYFTS